MSRRNQLGADDDRSLRRWLLARRLLGVTFVFGVFLAVLLLTFGLDDGPGPILPDTDEQFSLDLEVVATADAETVYVVEQRARPSYRIFSFDPSTGEDATVFTVPEDAIIYGISLSPDRSTLAVGYTPDFHIEGSGLWTLDLETGEFEMAAEPEPDIYLTEIEWAADGASVFATHVDRSEAKEVLSIASVDLASGVTSIVLDQAITPAVQGSNLYYLTVDDEKARRAIGVLAEDATVSTIEILDSERDLDHLVAGDVGFDEAGEGALRVAVLDDQDDGLLSVGSPALAHGNHNIRSTWWDVELVDGGGSETPLEPIIVYDASMGPSGSVVYATLEGLSIGGTERTDLIESRAIRFVAA